MDDEKGGLLTNTLKWFRQPFNTQGSALNWVLIFGLAIVAVWFWSHVVMSITDDV
jgi:hypothetical protein